MSTKKQVVKATSFLMVVTVFAKIVGFVREQVIANHFGATGLTDAYVSAQLIPTVLVSLIGSTVSMALLPVFTGYMGDDRKKEGWQVAGTVILLTFLLLAFVAAVGILAAPFIVKAVVPSMPAEFQNLTAGLLRVMFPGAVFLSLAVVASILLNAHQRFVVPALSPVVMNAVIIFSIIFLADRYGVYGLAWGTLGGMFAQFIWVFAFLRKTGWDWRCGLNFRHPAIGEVFGIAWPLFLGGILTQIYQVIEKILGSGLAEGSISALYYALKLVQLPVAIFITAVTTVVFPTLAKFAAEDNREGLANALFGGLRIMTLVALPAAVGMMVLKVPIVRLAFERGAFDAEATFLTAGAIFYYSMGIMGTAGVQILSRTFYALKDSRTPLLVSLLSAILYFGTAALLVRFMAHKGLALAFSLGLLFNAGVLYFLALRRLGAEKHRSFAVFLCKVGTSTAFMGATVYGVYTAAAPYGGIVSLGTAVLAGVVVYSLAIFAWRLDEGEIMLSFVRKKFSFAGFKK